MKVLMTYAGQTPHHDFPVMTWYEEEMAEHNICFYTLVI